MPSVFHPMPSNYRLGPKKSYHYRAVLLPNIHPPIQVGRQVCVVGHLGQVQHSLLVGDIGEGLAPMLGKKLPAFLSCRYVPRHLVEEANLLDIAFHGTEAWIDIDRPEEVLQCRPVVEYLFHAELDRENSITS